MKYRAGCNKHAQKLVELLNSGNERIANNAATAIVRLLQSDDKDIQAALEPFVEKILAGHEAHRKDPSQDPEAAASERLFRRLLGPSQEAIRQWIPYQDKRPDPHPLTALLVLMDSETNPTSYQNSLELDMAKQIFSRHRQRSEKGAPVTPQEIRIEPETLTSTRKLPVRMWSNSQPDIEGKQPYPVLSGLGETRNGTGKEHKARLAAMARFHQQRLVERKGYDMDRTTYEMVRDMIGNGKTIDTIDPTLLILAQRYDKPAPDIRDQITSALQDNIAYQQITFESDSVTPFNRLVTVPELEALRTSYDNDVVYMPARWEDDNRDDINAALQKFRNGKGRYMIMPLYRQNHFITMVVTKSSEPEQGTKVSYYEQYRQPYRDGVRLHASILDTLPSPHRPLRELASTLHVDDCELDLCMLQEGTNGLERTDLAVMANSCGIFSVLMQEHLLNSLQQQSGTPAPDCRKVISDFIGDFGSLDGTQRGVLNVSKRLEVLDTYMHTPTFL